MHPLLKGIQGTNTFLIHEGEGEWMAWGEGQEWPAVPPGARVIGVRSTVGQITSPAGEAVEGKAGGPGGEG